MKTYTIKDKLNCGTTITITMDIPDKVLNDIISSTTNELLKKYLNNPYGFAENILKYSELQETAFDSLTLPEKVEVIQQFAEKQITAQDIYNKVRII